MTRRTTAFFFGLLLAGLSVLSPITAPPVLAANEAVERAEKSIDITNKKYSMARWHDIDGAWVLFAGATGAGVVADTLNFRPVLPGPNIGTVSFELQRTRIGRTSKYLPAARAF